ncbi:MAG: TIR domain-containing protein [Propionivibrio sp.]|uniref:TIR domain-containing protein n=1 Tax=Propionivibrio sp. TaxID=2212460 RepID=UPI001A419A6A|nr:TIR domain-containing protein [Propionivibrio sp.]MBL8414407.1 TIR domain-containing protein [Propionivibrio sp.]
MELVTLAPAVHDAFISYSQSADARLASALERGLESLAKPLFRLRAIDVFRDKTGLSASPGLWSGIAAHLEASCWLIFLASPKAATSPWCTKELLWWLDRHGTEGLLIVLTDGALVRDADVSDFDWGRTDALPDAARGRFAEEPLYVDLRWAGDEAYLGHRDPRLRPALLDLAAPIRGVPKDILDGEDVRQLRRTRRIAIAAVAGIVTAAALAVWQAVEATRQRDEAIRLREQALSRQLAAQSASLLVRDPVLALQLAADSRAIAPTSESSSALLGAVTALPLTRMHQHGSAWWALALRPGQDELLLSDMRGAVFQGRLDQAALQTVVPPAAGLALFRGVDAFAFAPDGQGWAHAGSSG